MAKERGLTYVKLDGDVGILGNGAGLCMSTLDVVANAGGEPANFLDAGGGSKADAIVDALEVITSDEKVTAVLFNIFGGITRCDEVAKGIIEAYERVDMDVPLVVRLDGTNSEEGLRLLREANLDGLYEETTMLGAAERVVELREGRGRSMSIIVGDDTKLVVSGLTGREGSFHGLRNRDYGTDLVAGVTPEQGRPGRRGRADLRLGRRGGHRARRQHLDDLRPRPLRRRLDRRGDRRRDRDGDRDHRGHPGPRHAPDLLEGQGRGRPADRPQLPRRAVSPARPTSGSSRPSSSTRASIGVVSKSGTLTYQIGNELKQAGLGNSSIVGIGGDPIVGSDFIDILELYENDDETELIVLVGEIGGDAEERAADYIAEHVTKPVVAYIAGFTAPPGKQMGHAGAIISGSSGTAEAKKKALEAKGVRVGTSHPRQRRSPPRSSTPERRPLTRRLAARARGLCGSATPRPSRARPAWSENALVLFTFSQSLRLQPRTHKRGTKKRNLASFDDRTLSRRHRVRCRSARGTGRAGRHRHHRLRRR